MNIKVLMIGNHRSVKGGITSVINQLLEYDWENNGVNVRFIATYTEASSIKKIFYFLQAYFRIFLIIVTWKPDIVHIHMSYKGSFYRKYLIHKLCKLFNVKDIIHLHGSEFEKWYKESSLKTQYRIKCLLKECKMMIVLGDEWNEKIKNIEICANTFVVSNAIHMPHKKASWNATSFQVLFLGVLIRRKGVADLLYAIKRLKDINSLKEMRFILAGSGNEEEELKELSKQLGLNREVTFIGWITGDKKEKLMSESQMLVLPSYNEGLPMAILEAISYGLPVVATDVGDVSAAVREGVNGYLIQPGDIEALVDRIIRVSNNQDTYQQMNEASCLIAETEFSVMSYYNKILDCYHQVNGYRNEKK